MTDILKIYAQILHQGGNVHIIGGTAYEGIQTTAILYDKFDTQVRKDNNVCTQLILWVHANLLIETSLLHTYHFISTEAIIARQKAKLMRLLIR